MRTRSRIAFAILVLAAVGGLVRAVFKPGEPEPAFQGTPLSVWLTGFDERSTEPRPDFRAAREAVRQIGTNAIPALLRMLRAKDSALTLKLISLVGKQQIIKIHHVPASTRNVGAAAALETLGAAAQDAVPQLIEMFDHMPSRQSEIALILSCIGPPAKGAIPSLLRAASNTNSSLRSNAVFALGGIHSEPETVVPVLIKAMRDPSDSVRYSAVTALLAFGTNASPAVPALIELIPRERERTITPGQHLIIYAWAEHVLKQIDSEAAARANPSIRHPLTVRIPTGLRVIGTDDALTIGWASLQETNLTVGTNMVLGSTMERQILRNGVPEKSAESEYEFNEWFGDGSTGTAVDFGSSDTVLHRKDGRALLPASAYSVEYRCVVFETDIPPQHFWQPTGGKYRVLWEHNFKETAKGE